MSLWPVATSQRPCPICGKPDWCAFGDYQIKCMRVESESPSRDGGWYHPHDGVVKISYPAFVPVSVKAMGRPKNFSAHMRAFREKRKDSHLEGLANILGVTRDSLFALDACYSSLDRAWAFPMHDSFGNVCGIRFRNAETGHKWAMPGSRQGVFLGVVAVDWTEPLMICEGPTDVAAALSMGFQAIGRPSCNSGAETVEEIVSVMRAKRVIIACDNDASTVKCPQDSPGAWWDGDDMCFKRTISPGIEGARRLKERLRRFPSVLWVPPAKDVREFYRNGGTKEMVNAQVKEMIWTKGK